MSDYIFRGKPISGPAAHRLLRSIKEVFLKAPNPTLNDIVDLLKIVDDFGQKFEDDLRSSSEDGNI